MPRGGGLFLEVRRQPEPISAAHLLQAGNKARLERHHIANALPKQQRLDAVGVSGALLDKTLALARPPLAVAAAVNIISLFLRPRTFSAGSAT